MEFPTRRRTGQGPRLRGGVLPSAGSSAGRRTGPASRGRFWSDGARVPRASRWRRHYVVSVRIVVDSPCTTARVSMNERDNDPDSQPRGVLPSRRSHDGEDPEAVDPEDVLDRLRVLQVNAWQDVAGDASGFAHLGPAAEDFHETFEVGLDPENIAAGDADGVAIAAIQGLAERLDDQGNLVERQEQRIRRQRDRIDEQRADIETLREELEALQSELSRHRLDSEE